jgi:hypothetical protein
VGCGVWGVGCGLRRVVLLFPMFGFGVRSLELIRTYQDSQFRDWG